jgi:hypothetical protein
MIIIYVLKYWVENETAFNMLAIVSLYKFNCVFW